MPGKKELRERYKSRKVVGGVYRIVNTQNGCFYLQSTDDMQSVHNLFAFSKKTGNSTFPPIPPLRRDWEEYGQEAFQVEELELLEKTPEQTTREFQEDLKVLLELWSEKLPLEGRY